MAENVKTVQGLAIASVKTFQGLAIASAKTVLGVDNTGGGGGIAFISSVAYDGGSTGGTSGAIDTTGADLIVIATTGVAGTTVSDSKGNSWTALTTAGSGPGATLHYSVPTTVGSGHTFTVAGSFCGLVALAFSGANAAPFDDESGAAATQPGTITPAGDGEVFVACWGRGDATALTIDSGFTEFHNTYNPGANYSCAGAYKIQTTGSAENPTTNASDGCSMAAFKPA